MCMSPQWNCFICKFCKINTEEIILKTFIYVTLLLFCLNTACSVTWYEVFCENRIALVVTVTCYVLYCYAKVKLTTDEEEILKSNLQNMLDEGLDLLDFLSASSIHLSTRTDAQPNVITFLCVSQTPPSNISQSRSALWISCIMINDCI